MTVFKIIYANVQVCLSIVFFLLDLKAYSPV